MSRVILESWLTLMAASAVCIAATPLPLLITTSFTPSAIPLNGGSVLSFTIMNASTAGVTGVAFSDTLPAGVVVFTPLVLTGSCPPGTIIATGDVVSLSGATLAVGSSCTFSVIVVGNTEGIKNNATSLVTSDLGNGNSATATLSVAIPPTITKSFGEVSTPLGSGTNLTFDVTNPNTAVNLTGVAFSDTLPAGLLVATPNGETGTCGGGVITAVSGTNTVSLTGGALAARANCTFSVNVTGTAVGLQTNTTSTVTSNEALPGNPAVASIYVGDPYQITYVSNLNVGDSFVNITNTGASGAGFGSGTSASVMGSICANVYVFDPTEEIVSCCSCPVTPNGLVSLSARNDLINNPLFPRTPSSIVIKLVATAPVGGTCNNSALLAGTPTFVEGVAAWGTKLHANTSAAAGTYAVTETRFTLAGLSAGEFTRLAYTCGIVANQGSGFGICNSCRLGGLGAVR
jgi:hypothetical protein